MASVVERAARIAPELANWLKGLAAHPLCFEGDTPLDQISKNYVRLWLTEFFAEEGDAVDLDFRVAATEWLIGCWSRRARPEVGSACLCFYVYDDLAPTLTVATESPKGFPFRSQERVDSLEELLQPFCRRHWSELWGSAGVTSRRIYQAVEAAHGDIGRLVAQRLGLETGRLRRAIEWFGLGDEVNRIRTLHQRPVLRFRSLQSQASLYSDRWRIYELKVTSSIEG